MASLLLLQMTFLYPGFLWALFALAIPVIVHLFNFRRTQKIYFSSTRFIREVQETSSAKRKLKHWLVLATRLLFLFFLVIVFAQPILPAKEQLQAGENIVIYLDNSQSMSAPTEGAAQAFDASLVAASTITDAFPADTRYRLLTNDFNPFANSLKTKAEVKEELAKLRISGKSRTAGEVMSRLQKLGGEKQVFWLSDFQKSTLGQPIVADSNYSFHLVPLRTNVKSNIFIDTVYMDNPFAVGGELNALTVKLLNDGDEDRRQINVRLVIDDLQVGTANTDIPANGTAEVNFSLPGTMEGMHKATLSLADAPITFDNDFYLVLNFASRIRVVSIEGNNTSIIPKVFGNNKLFDFVAIAGNNIDYSLLSKADLLIINEVVQLDQALQTVLQDFLSVGGSVLIIPAANPALDSYRSLIPAIVKSSQSKPLELSKPDSKNPFFENVFQEAPTQIAMPAVKNSIDWGLDRQAILKQQDDRPYLSQFSTTGKLYVLGGPLKIEFGSFFNHSLVVPVMYRMAAFSRRNQVQLYHALTVPTLRFRADSLEANQLIVLQGMNQVVPAQRLVNQEVLGDLSGLDIEAGHYYAKANADTLSILAFNQQNLESRLNTLSNSELEAYFGEGVDVYELTADSTTAMADALKENYQGNPLWKYALIISLIFLLMEILILSFWR